MAWTFWFTAFATLLVVFDVCETARYQRYRTRASQHCHIPRGDQYGRSRYMRVYGANFRRLRPGSTLPQRSRIIVYCKKDVQHDAILSRTISRCLRRRWRPELPSCIDYRCGDIPYIENTIPSEEHNEYKTYPNGYVVSYACPPDLVLFGSNSVTCMNGNWTAHAFSCRAPVEPELCRNQSVENADVTEISATLYKVSCHHGYITKGNQTVFKCVEGEWITQTPRCHPKICPKLYLRYEVTSAHNGSQPVLAGDLAHGQTVRIQCQAGQKPYNDVTEVTCDNGRWKPRRPICKKYCRIRSYLHRFSRFTVKESDENLRNYMSVAHGQVINQYCRGEQIPMERRCMNGRWLPSIKRCFSYAHHHIHPISAPMYRAAPPGDRGCPLIEGKTRFVSMADGFMLDVDSVIEHGGEIRQICEEGRGDPKHLHIAQCNQGRWEPDLKACPDRECDRYFNTLEIPSGTIHSPGRNGNFPMNTICSYRFVLDGGERLNITFDTFKLSGNQPNCMESYLGYQSGENAESYTKLCGDEIPPSIVLPGPEALISWNTFRAEVAQFKAKYEVIYDSLKCFPPDASGMLYAPIRARFNVGDAIQIVSCRDKASVYVGTDTWLCQPNGTWNATGECLKFKGCVLPKKNGITYGHDVETFSSGTVPHGSKVNVFTECGDVYDVNDDNKDAISYNLIGCENGKLTDDVFGCPDIREVSESQCAPPIAIDVHLEPRKPMYRTNESVHVTGCRDKNLLPVGASELVCMETGDWFGLVQCLTYCENGVVYPSATVYSAFRRSSGVRYRQIGGVQNSSECLVHCELNEEFECRSFEYREKSVTCVLIDEEPNPESFLLASQRSVSRIYERACDDKCHVPFPKPIGMIFSDNEGRELVAKQAVLTGSTIKVTCERSTRTDDITCIGGKWDIQFDGSFCEML